MDTNAYRDWYTNRVEIADAIVQKYGQQGEPDAEILLCCATSSLASQMWPREGIDKKRFVEFLVRFSEAGLSIQKISIPLLANRLEAKGDLNLAINVRRTFIPFSPVVLDATNDKNESEVITAFPSLTSKEIRNCSYASSIYSDLRSGLVHEYQLSSHLVPYTLSDRTDIPSYLNLQDYVPGLATGDFVSGETRRYLHFPYTYIRNVSNTAAITAFEYWRKQNSWHQPEPQNWWIEG